MDRMREREGGMELVVRPWGDFQVLKARPGVKIKLIRVKPGGKTSLQCHRHRREHWTVVAGIMTVTVDELNRDLGLSESLDVPLGAVHRLENLQETMAELLETQFGEILSEDDIIRFHDIYGRV